MTLPAPTRTESIRDLGNNVFHYHRLLPSEFGFYDMSVGPYNKNNPWYFYYSKLDPQALGTSLELLGATIHVLGPKLPNAGGVLFVIEHHTNGDDWTPLLVCDDNQIQAGAPNLWEDHPFKFPVTAGHRFCIDTQYTGKYVGQTSWHVNNAAYRSVELDMWYRIVT